MAHLRTHYFSSNFPTRLRCQTPKTWARHGPTIGETWLDQHDCFCCCCCCCCCCCFRPRRLQNNGRDYPHNFYTPYTHNCDRFEWNDWQSCHCFLHNNNAGYWRRPRTIKIERPLLPLTPFDFPRCCCHCCHCSTVVLVQCFLHQPVHLHDSQKVAKYPHPHSVVLHCAGLMLGIFSMYGPTTSNPTKHRHPQPSLSWRFRPCLSINFQVHDSNSMSMYQCLATFVLLIQSQADHGWKCTPCLWECSSNRCFEF